ncbi:MAG: hypothetical protein AB7P02_16620 [Alphaproteobacteria bacterium]
MSQLLKIAAPLIAGIGVLAATMPASAACYYDPYYGQTICRRPPPPPVYVAPPPAYYVPPPPVYVAPPPRVVVAPQPYYRHYHHRPAVSFGFAF